MNPTPSNRKSRFSGVPLFIKETLIAVMTTLLLVVFPEIAHAGGLLSFLQSFTGEPAMAQESVSTSSPCNSQTCQILGDTHPYSTSTDDIYIADNALMPSSGPSGTIADVDNAPSNTAISTYVVQPGDNLSTIADMFDVSVNTIVWANDLTTRTIQPGQTLIILPVSGISYTIKKGDTLQSLAKKYTGASTPDEIASVVGDIVLYNGLASATAISVGDTVIIPDGELGSVSSNSSSGSSGAIPIHTSHGTIYEPYIPGDSGPSIPGYYACPVESVPGNPVVLTQGLHGHNAVDLAQHYGSPIYAAADGTVIIAKTGGWNGGYGNYVVIAHPNGTETLYAHAEKLLVSVGQHVNQGDTIARIGLTGETTGPHVHFEVRGAANPFVSQHC